MKRKLFLITLLMMLCSTMFGQFTPRYPYVVDGVYQFPMTLSAVIEIDGVEQSGSNLELGVFCGEELRGSAFLVNVKNRYYARPLVYGQPGQYFTFKLYDHNSGEERVWNVNSTFTYGSTMEYMSYNQEGCGELAQPAVIDFVTPNYWNPNYTAYENNFDVIAVVLIDGIEQTNANFELGAFSVTDGSVRGSVKLLPQTILGNTRYYADMLVYGQENEKITFKLYNHDTKEVFTFVDVNTCILTEEKDDSGNPISGSYVRPVEINFLTTPYVAQVGEVKYQSFANAFNAALENNATITLLEDFAIDSETYTVADGKNVTLNMNGKKITVKDNKTSNYELFYIYGGMTVEGEGTIELTATYDRDWNASSSIFHNRGGVLNVENGTFKHNGGTDMAYVIDNSGNWYGDATTNITAGELTSSYIAIRNRMEQNTHGASGETILNITGGTISGTSRAIWAQAASTSTEAPATGKINISGGTIGLIDTPRSTGAFSMTTVTGGTVAAFKGEAAELKVTGGTIGTVTIMTAEGDEVSYAITSEGLYVAAVAEVNGNYYATLQEAVNVANGSEIKIISDFKEVYTVGNGANANINLNGHTLTGSILAPNAKLTVENGNIINKDGNVSAIEINYGELALNNVNISSARHAVRIDGDVKATINGGEYTLNATSGTRHAVNVSGAAEVTITAGKFVGPKGTTMDSGSAVNVQSGAKVIIEGGDFSGGKKATLGVSGTMELKGGTYDQDVTKYCAEGYICEFNTTKAKYEVIEGLKGKGTEAEPFIIKNLKDLTFFRNSVNAGETKYNAPDVWVALGADIDMTGVNWVGIGSATADHGFMGNFDGKNFKIKNLTITNPALDSDGYAYAGLFAVTEGTDKDNQNTIKNLTIENVTINTTGHIVSAAIAYPYYTIVDNVKVCGDIAITGGDYTSGVLAYTRRCVNASNLSIVGNEGSYITGRNTVGGVISDIQMNGGLIADYKNFSAEGLTITGTKSVGGISGIICKQTLDGASVNNVTLTSSDVRVGIVSGSWGDVSTISKVTFADVTGATAIIGATYKDGAAVEARIGDTYYGTFAAALEAADEDDIVTLLVPYTVEAGETLTINKNVTYSSNVLGEAMITNKGTLTITGSVDYTYTGAADATYGKGNYTINNSGTLTVNGNVENKTAKMSHASYAINTNAGATLNVESGKVLNLNGHAIRMVSFGTAANNVNINGGYIEGTRALQVQLPGGENAAAPAMKVNINGGELKSNEETYNLAVYVYSNGQSAENFELAISGGTFNGNVAINAKASETMQNNAVVVTDGVFNGQYGVFSYSEATDAVNKIAIKGGDFATNYSEKYAEDNGYIFVPNAQRYTVEQGQYVAKIGEVRYASLAEAIAKVQNGETIELITDCAENVTISQKTGLSFTIDGNGKTYTGTINVNGNNKGAGLIGAGLTITNVNFVLNGQWQSGIFANKGTYACNIIVDQCSFTGNNAKEAYGIRLRSGYNITVKNITGKNLYDLVYAQENVKGFTAENVNVTDSNIGFWFPYGNNLNFINVNLDVTGTGVGIINRNAGEATFENCTIIAKNAVTLSQDNNNAIAYTLKFNGKNEFTTSEEWLTVTGTNAVLKAVLNDAELDVTETSGLVANIGNVYYNTLQHAINAAQDGGTVAIANDFTLDSKKYEIQNDGYAVYVNVKGKAVTIDLNGKTMKVNPTAADFTNAKGAMLLGIFSADTDGHLTLVDSSDDAKGTVNVNVNDAKVYSLGVSESLYADKSNSGKLTIVSGNYNVIGKLANAMFFSDADEVITINGGKFHLDYASTIANYPWFVNTLGNNEIQVVVNGGTFNVDINHQYRPFEIKIAETLAVKNNGDGTWTIVSAEAFVTEMLGSTVNEAGYNEHKVGYATLEEAIAAVNNLGNDVTLLKDVTIDELIKIEKEATLDLNGNKVTSTAKKAFEVYADATITNGTIEAANRAVDTRTAVKLTLTDVTLVADKYYSAYGNPQPLTIGGYDHGTVVTLNNVDINAGTAGYGIITFVKTTLTADEKTNVYGYAALYVQDGSEGSEFVFNGSTLTGDLTGNDVEGNSFSTIAIQEDGVNVTMNGGKLISVGDNHTALSIGNVNVPVHENNNVTIDAEITGNILSTVCADENVIRVKAEYADNLNTAGYATSEPEEDGLVTVLGQAVAQVDETLYATLQDAIDAADGKTVVVLTDINLTEGVTVEAGKVVTLDLAGYTISQTKEQTAGYQMILNDGTLTIEDSSDAKSGKISYTDSGNGGEYISDVIYNRATLVINGGTIVNLSSATVATNGYPHAVDTYSGIRNTSVTINGGTIYCAEYSAVRMFCVSATYTADLTINDGTVRGAIDMQNGTKNAAQGSLTINGGNFETIKNANNIRFANWNGGATEYGIVASVTGGNFNGGITTQYVPAAANFNAKFIKGGTFVVNPSDYCAYGYTAEYNEDDELYYVKETYGTQTHSFQAGWNWFSSYVDLSQQGGLEKLQTALVNSTNATEFAIKGQTVNQSVQYGYIGTIDGEDIYGWTGKQDWNPYSNKMYMIKTSDAISKADFELSGDFVDYENTTIALLQGWNWISYPINEPTLINEALKGLVATEGDKIKFRGNTFAEYYDGEWDPVDFVFEPGQGYMYEAKNPTSFVYSKGSGNTSSIMNNMKTVENNHWTPSMSEYANNMTITAMLSIEGEYADDSYEVAAFANGECRGSVRPVYVERLNAYMIFLTVYGDEVEEMTFKCYDTNNDREYTLSNVVVYSNDAVLGSIREPYIMTCNTMGIDEATISNIHIYPNPTTTDREINLQATCDKVEVFNTLGVKVAEYQNVDTIDALETAGTYVIRVTLNGDVKHCRLVVK